MTDSFQAHKDVMKFLSQARAMCSRLVKRLYCAVCAVFVGVLSTGSSSVTSRVAGVCTDLPCSRPRSFHEHADMSGTALVHNSSLSQCNLGFNPLTLSVYTYLVNFD